MFVRYGNVMHSSSCQVLSSIRIECRSPPLPASGLEISPEQPLQLEYGFVMGSVPTVQNLSKLPGFLPFFLYPDPVYEKFDEEVKYYKSDYLIIKGKNLDRACRVLFLIPSPSCLTWLNEQHVFLSASVSPSAGI